MNNRRFPRIAAAVASVLISLTLANGVALLAEPASRAQAPAQLAAAPVATPVR